MTSKTIPDIAEAFKQAAEIAKQVPENMQVAAFNRALDLLTTKSGAPGRDKSPNPSAGAPVPQAHNVDASVKESRAAALLSAIDTTQHPAVAATSKVLDRALMVLQIALRNHNIDGLTPPEVARILTEKFRLNTSRQAVSMAIGAATNLVNRVPRGGGYEYRIMGPGEEYLTHLGSHGVPSARVAPSKAARARRVTKGRKKEVRLASDATDFPGAVTRASRPGPKQLLEQLIADKFFDTARSIGQMIDYIRDRHARTYKATDLSPALTRLRREDKLDRTKNANGVYEYVVHR